jgi:hypothetical protein
LNILDTLPGFSELPPFVATSTIMETFMSGDFSSEYNPKSSAARREARFKCKELPDEIATIECNSNYSSLDLDFPIFARQSTSDLEFPNCPQEDPVLNSFANTPVRLATADDCLAGIKRKESSIESDFTNDKSRAGKRICGGFAQQCGELSICTHGNSPTGLKKTNKEAAKCSHGRQKSQCKDCGGGSICSHGRLRTRCKECGGTSICSHGRQKSACKECGGSSYCSHGRIKSQCKDCGGASICSHGRYRSKCKECGGSSFCSHGRQKYRCKECGGSSICSHGRRKWTCKECGGASICSHGREKCKCKDCGGSSFCSHGRRKSTCKECKRSATGSDAGSCSEP